MRSTGAGIGETAGAFAGRARASGLTRDRAAWHRRRPANPAGRRGLLLRDAVNASAAVDQVADIDLEGVPVGNAALIASWAACQRITEHRQHDRAIRQVETEYDVVRRRPSGPVRAPGCTISITWSSRPAASRAAQAGQVVLESGKVGIALVSAGQDHDHPGRTKQAILSTWPPVTSPAKPCSSQITWLTPRQSARTLSMPARSSPGLRFGSSTEGAHTIAVPSPSTCTAPPSSQAR